MTYDALAEYIQAEKEVAEFKKQFFERKDGDTSYYYTKKPRSTKYRTIATIVAHPKPGILLGRKYFVQVQQNNTWKYVPNQEYVKSENFKKIKTLPKFIFKVPGLISAFTIKDIEHHNRENYNFRATPIFEIAHHFIESNFDTLEDYLNQ